MKPLLLTFLSAVTLAASAHATVILEWNTINGDGTNNAYAAIGIAGNNGAVGTVNSGLEASSANLTRGIGFGSSGFAWSVNRLNTQNGAALANLTAAISDNQYVGFTLDPLAGQQFSLSSASFYVHSQSNGVAGELLFSTNGFSSYTSLGSVTNSNGMGGTTGTLDLTGFSALQSSTAATEFRIYFYGNSAWELRGLGANADLTPVFSLNGSVTAVPEPSTGLLLVGGLLFSAMRRRPNAAAV